MKVQIELSNNSVMISSLNSGVLSSNLGLAKNTDSLNADLMGQLSDTDKSMNTESTDKPLSVILIWLKRC